MLTKMLETDQNIRAATALSASAHERLLRSLPFLPARPESYFFPKLAWMRDNGKVMGLFEGERLAAFMGGFIIDDFRNAGPGAFCPDWSHGAAAAVDASRAYVGLYRALAPLWIAEGARLHALSLYSSEPHALEALSLTGFGRIVMDAARPTKEIAAALDARPSPIHADVGIRVAGKADAPALAELDAVLAGHIAASPVLMPNTRGRDADEWREWLADPGAVAFIATGAGGEALGFIKAEPPQFDVSDSVHAETTLAIDGMLVLPGERSRGLGGKLLSALCAHASSAGKTMMSVDCETMNPEAYGFWSKWFRPVAWCMERRV
jgi:GNAT superfamily N-acetyltransferase